MTRLGDENYVIGSWEADRKLDWRGDIAEPTEAEYSIRKGKISLLKAAYLTYLTISM